MAGINAHLLLIMLMFFLSLDFGSCIKCYHCFAFNNTDCSTDPFVGDKVPMMICPEGSICGKINLPSFLGYPESVHRSCIPLYGCFATKGLSSYCYECDKELCNSSSVLVPSFVVVFCLVKHYLL